MGETAARTGDVLSRRLRRRTLGAALLGLLLTLPAMPAGLPLILGTTLIATEAAAQSRSSGGYSRPRASSGRTPSFGGSRVSPRTPSTSGGYRRPDFGGAAPSRRPSVIVPSPADRGVSREGSAGALNRYREQQDALRRQREAPIRPPVTTPVPSPLPAPSGGGGFGLPFPRGGYPAPTGAGRPPRPDWYRDRGWQPAPYAYGTRRNFGIWDGLFLWFLLDNLTRSGSTDFFRNHRDDPAIREWRAEADRLARDNADLRARLDQLDRELARDDAAPADPNYLPPGVTPDIALAPREDMRTPSARTPEEASGGVGFWALPVLLVGGGALFLFARRRRAPDGGSAMRGTGTADRIGSAAGMLRHKIEGGQSTPASPFRVGMTVTADPTPFILAAGATKVPAPEGIETNPLLTISEVGRINASGLVRLRTPDGRGYFQLHLDANGQPDECRWFGVIDEVTPADEAEWAVWLDPNEGLLGWPQFETKDGKLYDRVWSPGDTRVAPRELTEVIEGLQGLRTQHGLAMLYAGSTGAEAPAPATEYILVTAIDAGGQAWVEIRAGLDINPATLSLA